MAEGQPERNIGLQISMFALAAIFLGAGGAKLAGNAELVKNFARWGYPSWFHLVIGGAEVALALLLVYPRTTWIGASGLVAIMMGAIYTHAAIEPHAGAALLTLFLAALATAVAWKKRPGA